MWASVRSYCPYCGSRAEDGDRFCRRCGTELDRPIPPRAAAKPPPEPASPAPEARRRGGGGAVWFVAAFVVIAAGVTIGLTVPDRHRGAASPNVDLPAGRDIGSTTPPTPPDPGLCSAKRIDPLDPRGRPGRCHTSDYTRLTVARAGHRLRMRSIDVRPAGQRLADAVGTTDGYVSENADGTFVVVSLSVTNRLDKSAQIDDTGRTQAALMLDDGKRYDEDFEAQVADDRSFAARSEPLQPEETAAGEFVFDLPRRALRRFTRHGGSLVIAELGQDVGVAERYGVMHLRRP